MQGSGEGGGGEGRGLLVRCAQQVAHTRPLKGTTPWELRKQPTLEKQKSPPLSQHPRMCMACSPMLPKLSVMGASGEEGLLSACLCECASQMCGSCVLL